MRVSRSLTEHADLDMATGERLVLGFGKVVPEFAGSLTTLDAVIAGASSDQALARATDGGLRGVALAIVAAWYTGTVGQGVQAVTVSYRDALMQRTVADALSPPTYARGGPGWWTAQPPEVDLPDTAGRGSRKRAPTEKAR